MAQEAYPYPYFKIASDRVEGMIPLSVDYATYVGAAVPLDEAFNAVAFPA